VRRFTNGYTSVYGHLQNAVGSIHDIITKAQCKEQSFEIELFKPDEVLRKKGKIIALSGNTGASEASHLLEFRDTTRICN
jgi:hypothetical protein